MQEIKCNDCGAIISINAKSCVNCGSFKPFKGIVIKASEANKLATTTRISFLKGGGKLKTTLWQKIGMAFLILVFYVFIIDPMIS
jgi:hypothetical protein